jgi:hypothetical protein
MKPFEIDIKHRIVLDGFVEQDLPYQCPICNTELTAKETIGFGNYPKGGWRASMKPNQTIGQGFECPKCFTKSCFHADKYSYQHYKDVHRF